MIKKNLFGQYIHKDSVVHKIDSRLKLVYVIILSILVFLINDSYKIIVFSIFIFIIILLSKIGFYNLIRNLRPFLFIFIFIFLMYILFSRNQLERGIITIWRFLVLILISSILTFTTTISSLINAIEKLLKPARLLGIKPRNIGLLISLTIRFVPVMFLNLEKLREAMAARLAYFKKLKHIKLLMIAMIERMLKSASTLSDAIQSRLYNENAESSRMKLSGNDFISIFFVLIFVFIVYY